MSLRARLTIGLVVLAAVGLLVLGAVTYGALRSFEINRVDDRAAAAIEPAARAFRRDGTIDDVARTEAGGVRPIVGPDRPGSDRPGRGPSGRGGPGPGGRPDGEPPPAGTYAQQRDAAGNVVGTTFLGVNAGETQPAAPAIPMDLAVGEYRTVSADGMSYRVHAARTPDLASATTVVAIPFTEVDATLDQLLLIEALVFAAVLLALAGGAWWTVRLGLRPLDSIGVTAGAIAAGDLSRRVERAEPRTEVGRLGLSLNAMLARLEQAFAERSASEERLRRFIADASHELRTPLASIRGYAELFRIGAAASPDDVEKAMTRIEDESARMGVLVEDLLALARLDEVRERHREPVDLIEIAGDAVADARAVAPQRSIELHGTLGPVVVEGDPGQLHQVLSNLMGNALAHTPADTPIEVCVSSGDGVATLEVRDHGPGLPTKDPSELFDRFWRADPGRGRGRAGAGLGLAIVAAIVGAHGGQAAAADAEGGGARFTVTLPLAAR